MKVKTETVLYLTRAEFDCLERACELCRDIESSMRGHDQQQADVAEYAKDALESLLDSLEGGETVDSL